MSDAMDDLRRFHEAQRYDYELALREIRRGRKESHYMWYIFPQLRGLGRTYNANYYGIADLDEARHYMADPVLGGRLIEISSALLELPGNDPCAVFGGIDTLKLSACMTLFERASGHPVFARVLDKYFAGQRHALTLEMLG